MELQSGAKIWDLQLNPPSSKGVKIMYFVCHVIFGCFAFHGSFLIIMNIAVLRYKDVN